MQTNAQRQFNANYKVIRQLWIMCGCKDVQGLKQRIKALGNEAIRNVDRELAKIDWKALYSRQSKFELEELKFCHYADGYDKYNE